MSDKPLIYVAGPYTRPDPVLNVRAAVEAADELVAMGAAVIVPHTMTMLWHMVSPKPIDDWYAIDVDILRHCSALIRLVGDSTGGDREVGVADDLGIDVFMWPGERQLVERFIGSWA